ncbi:hypothetical protein [Leptolyngbya ohadii]|uniref:hypothetical protein n=1 Tax=Leptolyngbya ohadii TaxID=1962290 RepID=UPI000B59E399|nr:hypothetical protein [Leptolyngbya ohadii]
MKRTLFAVGLPIVTGLSLTLASCGGPTAEREDVQQPGAAPTQVGDDEEDDNVPGNANNQDNDEDNDEDNDNDGDND